MMFIEDSYIVHPIASLTEAIGFIHSPIRMGHVSLADLNY